MKRLIAAVKGWRPFDFSYPHLWPALLGIAIIAVLQSCHVI